MSTYRVIAMQSNSNETGLTFGVWTQPQLHERIYQLLLFPLPYSLFRPIQFYQFVLLNMRESTQITCNCYPTLAPSDKLFLARNHPLDHSASQRPHKSTQLHTPQLKNNKKSLKKKRPRSYHQTGNQPDKQPWKTQLEEHLGQLGKDSKEGKQGRQGREGREGKGSFGSKIMEAPVLGRTNMVRNSYTFRYPQTTTNARTPFLINSHQQIKDYQPHPLHQFKSQGSIPLRLVFEPSAQLQSMPMTKTAQRQVPGNVANSKAVEVSTPSKLANEKMRKKYTFPQYKGHASSPFQAQEFVFEHESPANNQNHTNNPYNNHLNSHSYNNNYRNDKMVTESWAHNQQDLLIQGFDKLFKNKEENMSQSQLPSSKRMNPRDVQRSKRMQKQQLMGRFAESGGEESDQQTPSEVIGRGFDRTYQEDLLFNEGQMEEQRAGCQTKASRSTNTKVSEMANLRRIGQPWRDGFAQPSSPFRTYKFL